jgi:hypothetical protein
MATPVHGMIRKNTTRAAEIRRQDPSVPAVFVRMQTAMVPCGEQVRRDDKNCVFLQETVFLEVKETVKKTG